MTRTQCRGFLAALFTSLVMLSAGCGDDEDESAVPPELITPPEISQVEGAELRIVHASPDAPPVDVYLQGEPEPLVTNLAYGFATDYIEIPYGSHIIELRPTGLAATSEPIFFTDPITFIPAERVTAVATGMLNAPTPDSSFRILPVVEGFGEPAPGTASAHIFHAGADTPTVGVDVGNDGIVEVERLDRFTDTGTTGVALPTGEPFQLGIVSETGEPLTAFTMPALTAGTEVLVITTGLLSEAPGQPNGFTLLAVGREDRIGLIQQNPIVYALHASPDAPAVDLFAAGDELADDLSFGELSPPIQVPPGTYALNFFGHQRGNELPASAPVAQATTPVLEAGQRYLLVASGFLTRPGAVPGLSLLTYAESFARAEDQVQLRLVHASPDAPAVDVGRLNNQGLLPEEPAFQDLSYAQSSAPEGVALPAAPVTVGITAANAAVRQPVASFSLDLSPFQGDKLFVVAVGALSPLEGEQRFQLVLVNTSKTPWAAQEVSPR